jgi:hypothetical protein
VILTHELHGRRVTIFPEAKTHVGARGTIQGVCYADAEARIELLVELDGDGQLEFFHYRQVRLIARKNGG